MATETQSIQQQESPAIEAYKLGLMQQAQDLIEKPVALPQPTTVGADPMTLQAQQLATQGIGGFEPYLKTGGQFITDAGGSARTGGQFGLGSAQLGQAQIAGTAAQYDPASAQAFMNPYETQVIDQALADIQRAGNIQAQADAARAVGAGAFGGSRSGIVDSERGRNILEQQARTAAGLRSQGYGQAIQQSMEAQEAALRRQQQAAGLFGQLGQLGADTSLEQAKTLAALGQTSAGLGQLGQQMQMADVNALAQLGAQQQMLDQAAADAQQQFQLQQIFQPYQKLGFYSDILQGAPSTSMSVTQNTAPRPSFLNQAVGAGIGGIGLANAAQNVGII